MFVGTRRALPSIVEARCAARTLVFCSIRIVEDAFGDANFFVSKDQSEECIRMVTIAWRADSVAKMDHNTVVVPIGRFVTSTDIATRVLHKCARLTMHTSSTPCRSYTTATPNLSTCRLCRLLISALVIFEK